MEHLRSQIDRILYDCGLLDREKKSKKRRVRSILLLARLLNSESNARSLQIFN